MEDLIGMLAGLGLDLPKVINVNVFTELVKRHLEERGYWERVRRFGFLIPVVIAFAMSSAVSVSWVESLQEAAIYGGASFVFHDLIATIAAKRKGL